MNTQTTEVKVYDYNENADSFNCTVNDVKKEIAAADFSAAYEAMQANIAADFSQPQQIEEYCLAMIYELHYHEEPSDLCFTFYRVNN